MPIDQWTLMWVQVGTGFTGALTLVFVIRHLIRKWGWAPETKVFFSPKGGCQEAVVAELKKARKEILVQAYSFTADPLTFALVEAKKRGLTVDIILDKSNEAERYSDLRIFLEQGLHPHIDAEHAIAHNKVIIIDRKIVITGSFNFTNQAEHENAENLLVLRGNADLSGWYRDNFFKHKAHAKPAQIKEPKDTRHGKAA